MAGILDNLLENLGNPNPLMQMGLGILAASSRPGQTTGGAIGEGMAMGADQIRRDQLMQQAEQREQRQAEMQEQMMQMRQAEMEQRASEQAQADALTQQFKDNPGLIDQILSGNTGTLSSLMPFMDDPMQAITLAASLKPKPQAPRAGTMFENKLIDPVTGRIIAEYETEEEPPAFAIKDYDAFSKFQATKRKGVQNVREAVAASDQALNLLDQPGPIQDLAAIITLQKALDPTSVVRESEQAMVRDAPGMFDRLKAMFQKAQGEGQLTPQARQSIRDTLMSLRNSYSKIYSARTAKGIEEAQRLQVPEMLIGDVYGPDPFAAYSPPSPYAGMTGEQLADAYMNPNLTPEQRAEIEEAARAKAAEEGIEIIGGATTGGGF